MSARMATKGGPPVPIQARIPVFAKGYLYSIAIRSNSVRTSLLVSYSSKASSGFSCIFLLNPLIHSTFSGFRARPNTASEQVTSHTSLLEEPSEADNDVWFLPAFKEAFGLMDVAASKKVVYSLSGEDEEEVIELTKRRNLLAKKGTKIKIKNKTYGFREFMFGEKEKKRN